MPTLYDDAGNPVEVPDAEEASKLRALLEEANKEKKDALKRANALEQSLQPYQQREREEKVTEAIGSFGPQAVTAWLKTQTDVELNDENVAAFVEEWGFGPPAGEQQQTKEASSPAAGYQPVPAGTPTSGEQKISWQDFQDMRRDPANSERAMRLFAEGKVQTVGDYSHLRQPQVR